VVHIHDDSSPRTVPPGTVHLWLFWADLPQTELARLGGVLDDAERVRAAAMTDPTRRRRFAVAHVAARAIVASYVGLPPGRLCWVRSGNGKPEVAGAQLGVNLSHSGALGAVAVTGGRPVGVDVQRTTTEVDPVRMARRYFPPGEAGWVAAAPDAEARLRRFTALWARKEACVKAAGARLMHGMRLPVHGGNLVRVAHGPLRGGFLVRDVRVPDGFQGAVALLGCEDYRVRLRWWTVRRPDSR
jgi:4'-phosphopantetheinyl transferase